MAYFLIISPNPALFSLYQKNNDENLKVLNKITTYHC